MSTVCIVTPTYNERSNIPLLIEKISALQTMQRPTVYVVDDNSPDGTGDVAEKLSTQFPVTVIRRPQKEGLGRAYVDAFQQILVNGNCNYIIQMDADLSHDPSVIPKMLEKMTTYDIVVGSRYVPGGAVVKWGLLRRLLSRFGNMYSRTVLNLPYRDVTSGFKCYRRNVLAELVRNSFNSIGYNFQIEILYRAHKRGYKIVEIPIIFTERKTGSSKINIAIILESFYKVLLLRFKKE